MSAMVVGVPREIKREEYRVGLTPAGTRELARTGHRVLVERAAGEGSGFPDAEYEAEGARIVDRDSLFADSALLVKVKEPLPEEYPLLHEGHTLFAYLHLAPSAGLAQALMRTGITAFAYETLEEGGGLPLLSPMSEIAGRMSPLVAAHHMARPRGGRGVLPTGAVGVAPADMLIIGAGSVGMAAARVAHALGMRVTVINRGMGRLREVEAFFRGEVATLPLTDYTLTESLARADAVVCAVLVPGGRAPVLITRPMLSSMRPGAVIVDVAIDQGGCSEASRPTTHDAPVFVERGVIHYCVANMPGAYPRTSTLALTNATLPYILRLAGSGPERAVDGSPAFASALNIRKGKIAHPGVASALDL